MKSLISFLFLNFICLSSLAEDRRTDPSSLTIMTYNTYFMWDGDLPEDCQSRDPIKRLPWFNDPGKALEHMADIAAVIKNNDPDMVNLVELESLAALEKLNNTFLKDSGYKAYMIGNNRNGVCQDVGLLTRIDPLEALARDKSRIDNSEGKSKGVRKNYYAKFEINSHKIALIGGHFKAIPDDKSSKEYREIQATILSDRADTLRSEGFLPIILGDFNDFDSHTLDRNRNRSITRTLKILRGGNTKTRQDDLLNVMQLISQPDRYTAVYDHDRDGLLESYDPDELSAIDHLLIDRQLTPFLERAYIDHTAPLNKHLDHRPIVTILKF